MFWTTIVVDEIIDQAYNNPMFTVTLRSTNNLLVTIKTDAIKTYMLIFKTIMD